LLPLGGTFVVRNVFTDLKRHDLGPAFHERDFDGKRVTSHVTEPLWGVGTTAPYGHDGRSVTLDAVIRRHGGEAAGATAAYVGLGPDQQEQIVAFLQTLVLFPPDDTASNLNPGVPSSDDPQNPANHGSINLGALFQIPYEGVE
jgi:cytochrome c peroxidase